MLQLNDAAGGKTPHCRCFEAIHVAEDEFVSVVGPSQRMNAKSSGHIQFGGSELCGPRMSQCDIAMSAARQDGPVRL